MIHLKSSIQVPDHVPAPAATVSAADLQPSATGRFANTLQLWHLLSLDASTVATLWTWFVADTVGVILPAASLLSMFLAVWMLYAADRILDARPLFSNPLHTAELEARHLFHHRHASAFLAAILLCSIALAALLPHLAFEALHLYAVLAALLFGWFLLIHHRGTPFSSAHRRLPKELAVGIFFPAAIFIPTVARRPDLRLDLLPHALLFAAVCSLNCLSIYSWEHHAPHTSAHWTTQFSTRHLRALALTSLLAGLTLTAFSIAAHTHAWPVSLASTLGALGLLQLNRNRHRLTPLTLRANADLVLLTPILLLPFLR